MAKFKSFKDKANSNKKKKGPKGKKAREKAKLDRQWGEVEVKKKDSVSVGKKILKKVQVGSDNDDGHDDDRRMDTTTEMPSMGRKNDTSDDLLSSLLSDDDDDGKGEDHDDTMHSSTTTSTPLFYTKLIESIQQNGTAGNPSFSGRRNLQHVYDDDDEDDDDSDDEGMVGSDRFGSMGESPDVIRIDQSSDGTNGDRNDATTSTTTTTAEQPYLDPFREKFVHNCTALDAPQLPTTGTDQTNPHTFGTFKDIAKPMVATINKNMITARGGNHVISSLLPIQDNTNIRVQVTKSLIDSWYIGQLFMKDTNTHHTTPISPTRTIIPKRHIQNCAELCRSKMSYIGKYTTAQSLSLSTSLSTQCNSDQQYQYLIPTIALPAMTSYADVLITTDGMNYGNSNNTGSNFEESNKLDRMVQLHMVTGMHILNHILSSRYNIHQHNKKLSKQQQQQREKDIGNDDIDRMNEEKDSNVTDNNDVEWQRDQGYTRPTVLILLPTRNCCYDFVQILLSLLYNNDNNNNINDNHDTNTTGTNRRVDALPPISSYGTNVENTDRFTVEYGPIADTVQTSIDEKLKLSEHRQRVLRQKGTLWNELFGDHRNDDDDYKIGLQINVKKYNSKDATKKNIPISSSSKADDSFQGSVKLYSDFYRSDIIIASPLGLKMAVANKKNDDDDENDTNDANRSSKSQDGPTDFLSSIEICMIGRGDVLLQQNWDHVTDVLKQINHIPKSMNMTDFSRVRPYCLSGQAHLWKQLIICSSHCDPMITSCFKRYGTSQSGVLKISRQYDVEEASLHAVRLPITRQVFQRVPTTSTFMNAGSDRVQYFCKYLWPEMEKQRQKHTLIFIPSYFDFITLRNILLQRKQDGIAQIDFVSVTEYSRVTEVSRGRARFLQGRKEVMLYTGRAHYFLRHAIKGVRHLIFLGVPEQASFYAEHVNRLNDGLPSSLHDTNDDGIQNSTCLALYTKYDSYALERIVGTTNCSRMVKGEKSTYYFSS